MLKIAFIDCEGTGDIGGGQRGLLDILRLIDKKQFLPIVICPGPNLLSKAVEKLGIKVYNIDFGSTKLMKKNTIPLISIPSLLKTLKIIKINKINLLFGNTYFSGKYTSLISIWTKIPSITMIRCIHDRPYLGYLIDRFLIKYSTKIICNTILAADILKKRSKNNQHIITIHNGMDLTVLDQKLELNNSFRTKYNIDPETKIIGMVAMFVKQKGHEILFEAAKELIDAGYNLKFVLVGGDFGYNKNEDNFKHKLKEMGLLDSFILTGFVENVSEIISNFDISVLLSQDSEGLPRAIMESMALGKPIVATNVGGIPELVKDCLNGLLCSPKNVNIVVEHLFYLLNDMKRALKMGLHGRSIIETKFDLKSKIIKFEIIFNKCSKNNYNN